MREQLQGRARKLTDAEAELEEARKSLYAREAHVTGIEKELGRQRDSLKKLKEWAEQREAKLEERSREVEVAKAALDTRVQEAVRKHKEDQRVGAQRIADWATEASLALVPLGMSPIQVAEPPASIADALPVLNSASDRLQRLGPVLAGQLEAEGRELIQMVAEHILTCLQSHDPAISLVPVVNGRVAETEAAARDSVREVVDFVAAYFKREPADP